VPTKRSCVHRTKVAKERVADVATFLLRQHISMADEVDIAHVLQTHDVGEPRAVVNSPRR
jgi:hypothetical protein